MNSRQSASAYHQTTALGASAVGQIVALYDIILRDLRQAMMAVEAGRIEERVNVSNHALVVIGELQGVLDFKRGGEAAERFSNFYTVARAMVTRASVMSSREQFQELITMFARVRAAWALSESKVPPSAPVERLRISSEQQTALGQTMGNTVGDPMGNSMGDAMGDTTRDTRSGDARDARADTRTDTMTGNMSDTSDISHGPPGGWNA